MIVSRTTGGIPDVCESEVASMPLGLAAMLSKSFLSCPIRMVATVAGYQS